MWSIRRKGKLERSSIKYRWSILITQFEIKLNTVDDQYFESRSITNLIYVSTDSIVWRSFGVFAHDGARLNHTVVDSAKFKR